MDNALQYLEDMIKRGYCLHGSPREIKSVLEPRQAVCETGRTEGCQKAIYASRDCVRVPMLVAMFSPVDPSLGHRSSYSGDLHDTLVVSGENITFRPGYVYVLPTDTFVQLGDEYISYQPVLPRAVVRVTPDLLRQLPNLDLRIPVPTVW